MTSKERRDRIVELQESIAKLRAEKHEKHDDLTNKQERELTEQIKDFGKQLVAVLTDGAKPCPKCGAMPHGMVHPAGVKGKSRSIYEIGCVTPAESTHETTGEKHGQVRAIDLLPEIAVERWNDGDFEAPSNGPGVVLGSKVSE